MKNWKQTLGLVREMHLHFLLAGVFAASLYPLAALLCSGRPRQAFLTSVLTGIPIGLTWLGMLLTVISRKFFFRSPQKFWWSCRLVTIVLLVAFGLAASSFGWLFGVLCGCMAAVAFYGGIRLSFLPLQEMTNPYCLVGICLWHLVFRGLDWLLDAAVFQLPSYVILLLTAGLFVIVHNQNALERVLHGRDNETWELPREIRSSNGRMLGLFGGIAVLLAFFCRPLGRLLRYLWHQCSIMLLHFLVREGDGETTPTEYVRETTPVVTEMTQQQRVPEWVISLVCVLFLFGVLALMIWKRREIRDGLHQCFCRLFGLLQQKFRKKLPGALPAETGAYCDYMGELDATAISNPLRKRSRRSWERQFARYHKLPMAEKRYRLGYQLALERLPEELRKPWRSPGEILQTVGANDPVWILVTEGYNQVRYGGVLPESAAFSALDVLLCRLAGKRF